jgi:hypothetical protein
MLGQQLTLHMEEYAMEDIELLVAVPGQAFHIA